MSPVDFKNIHDYSLLILSDRISPCIGPFVERISRPFNLPTATVLPSDQSSTATDPCHSNLATWICETRLFFTLFTLSPGQRTYVVDNSRNVTYVASPLAQLAPQCPVNTAFIGQFTLDKVGDGKLEPRLLIFDVVSEQDCQVTSPVQRYEKLRNMEHFLPKPLCCIQWIGERHCMSKEFLRSLPHDIAGVMWLGDGRDLFSVGGVEYFE
jgi:hypothetical protein